VGKKCAFIEPGEGRVLRELDIVFIQMMMVFHYQIVELVCCKGKGVGFPERGLECFDEVVPNKSVLR